MKIEIFGEEKTEQVLRLRLQKSGSRGGVDLVAVDINGKMVSAGYILNISDKGVTRHYAVNPELGLPVTDAGKIKIN